MRRPENLQRAGEDMKACDANGLTEQAFLEAYRNKHYPAPYLTADVALLSTDGRVLLIRRKGHPYLGCLALPGGFVNPDESAKDAALRELSEETGVALAEADLHEIGLFSKPGRDPRGWIVSDAFFAVVDGNAVTVSAGADAADAEWIPAVRNGDAIVLPAGERLAFDHEEMLERALAIYEGMRKE